MRSCLVSVALFSVLCFFVIPQVFAGSVSKVSFATVTLADGSHSIQDLFKVTGVPAWDVESVAITPPEGMDSQVISNLRYNFSYTSDAGTILGPLLGSWLFPIEGGTYEYDFKLWDGSSLTNPPISTDYLGNDLPVVDAGLSPPNNEYTGTTTPTLSWDPVVDDIDDSLYYRVVIEILNEQDFNVWTSDLITSLASMSVIVPPDILSENDAYRWFVEVYDSDSVATAQNISRSDSNRFYTGNLTTPLSIIWTRTNSRVRPGRYEVQLGIGTAGPAPWHAEVLIEGSDTNDNVSQTLTESSFYNAEFYYGTRSETSAENLADQGFTFTVTDNRSGADPPSLSTTTTLVSNWTIPFHQSDEMYQVPEDGYLYTTTPTFSWEALAGLIEYRIVFYSYGNYRFYWGSPWSTDLSVVVPAGILKKDSSYQWRVETRDSSDFTTANRGRGDLLPFFIADDKAPLSVTGQITIGDPPGYSSGNLIHIEATDSPDWPGGTKFSVVKIFPSSLPANYTLHNIPRDQNVYFHALWDKDGSESISIGDYKGLTDVVTPATGDVPSGVNIDLSTELAAASSFGGTITCDNWITGYGDIYIAVLDDSDEPVTLASTSISSPGTYTIPDPSLIPVGGYVIVQAFWDTDSSGDLSPTDQVLLSGRTLVTPSNTVDLDIGTQVPISGKVLKVDAATPIANLHLYVQDSQTGDWIEGTHTDDYGFYYMTVPPGVYKIRACPSCDNLPYLDEYYENVVGFDQATDINTTSGVHIDINFTLEDPVYISGIVKDSSNNPLANIPMTVANENGNDIGWERTDSNGAYSFPVSANNNYYVHACPQCDWDGSTQPYIDKYYGDVDPWEDGAVPNVVVGTENVPGIDFTLEGALFISGVVRDLSGNPLANIPMTVADETGNDIGWERTDSNGAYLFPVSANSSYYVHACPQCNWDWGDGSGSTQPYIDMYWENADPWEGAEPNIDVGGIDVPNINFTLEGALYISGTVMDSSDPPTPLANIPMTSRDANDQNGNWVVTDSNGYYSLAVASDSSYYVEACPQCGWGDDNSTQPYLNMYYNNADPWADDAIPNVDVEGIDVPDIDFSLEDAIYISGTVTDSLGNPIVNIPMEARDENGDFVGQTVGTADDGSYSVAVSASDSYYVWACPQCEWWDGSAEPYVNMYWDDADPWAEGAEPNIPVGTTHVIGKDFTLESPVYIFGTVFNSNGTVPLANIPIVARNENDRDVGEWVGTDDYGNYSLPVSPNKSYYVYAEPQNEWWDGSAEPYINKYWGDVFPWEEDTDPNIYVGTDDVFNKIFLLEDATYISGNVFEDGGITTIANLHVYFVDSETDEYFGGTDTDDTGFYSFALPAGTYTVRTCPSCSSLPYLGDEYLSSVDTSSSSQSNINFSLTSAAVISGTVQAATTSIPIVNLHMEVFNSQTGDWVEGNNTNDNGFYYLPVPTGTYRITTCASCDGRPYIDENYDNQFGSEFTPVEVIVGQDPGVFNFSLNLIVKGDINGDEAVDLEDAIIGLKITSGIDINGNIFTTGTVDDNDKIGLPEVIYILDDVANP